MDIILPPKKNIILDATVLSTLMSCPRLADFRFNHHFQSNTGKSPSLEMGSIVHTFLEFYYKSIIQGINRKDAVGYGMSAAQEYANSEEAQNTPDEDKQFALDTCMLYIEFWKNDSWIPLEVECVKGRVIYEDDEIRLMWKAKFDLLSDTNQGIYPVDHKTMKQRRDTISLNNQFMGQCVLAGTRMMFVNKIGFQKSLKPQDRFTRTPVTYTFDRLAEWQESIVPYWAKQMLMYAEGEYYPPNFTHCENKYGFCQFREVCESNRNVREEAIRHNFVVGEPWAI